MNAIYRLIDSGKFPVYAGLLGFLLMLPAAHNGFFLDDYYQQMVFRDLHPSKNIPRWDFFNFMSGDPALTQDLIARGIVPWWTDVRLKFHFFRPVASLTHFIDYSLWPDNSKRMLVQNILWMALLVTGAGYLFRLIIGHTRLACLATFLFAVDDVHGHAAGWISNRNTSIGACFGIISFYCFIRWSHSGRSSHAVLSAAGLIIALLSSESSLSIVCFFPLWIYCLSGSGHRLRSYAKLIIPGIIVLAWLVLYRIEGFGAEYSGLYINPALNPPGFIAAAGDRLPSLFFSLFLSIPAEISFLVPGIYFPWIAAFATALTAAIGLLFFRLLRNDRLARFFLFSCLVSLLPLASTFTHDRLLLVPGFASTGLLAVLIREGFRPTANCPEMRKLTRRAIRITSLLLLMIHAVFSVPGLLFNSISFSRISHKMMSQVESTLTIPDFRYKSFVFINAPISLYVHHMNIHRIATGKAYPEYLRVFAPATSEIELIRMTERKLILKSNPGLLTSPMDALFRDIGSAPFKTGDTLILPDMNISVLDADPKGYPTGVCIELTATRDIDDYIWLGYRAGRFDRILLPEPGGSLMFAAGSLLDINEFKKIFE